MRTAKNYQLLIYVFLTLTITKNTLAQNKAKNEKNEVYVDQKGILRWTKTNEEASFFGVNYTAPFAYGYRSVKTAGIDPEKSIEQDVYHMSRIGIDAFRVHIWETEFTDTLGNLLQNDHLKLFDYLLSQLKKRHIKVIITAIAFNGNGYPEKDGRTPGFAGIYAKSEEATNPKAIKAEENYIKQLFVHVNPYTKESYKDDPNIIATELNNEPSHSGPKNKVTEYINRLCNALKEIGWSKPVFYNISQGPYYADAVAKADVNGFSFQWYPSGLVSGHWLKYNFLPNVDRYTIPYDTIPAFANKARMIYEFDAGDVLGSYLYPAIARSFKAAGFQWATQFAYDPMATAYANTEYQTHYLNLAYTPSKAISMLIGSKAFHKLPRGKRYGTYPADSSFDVFKVSYQQQLSLMNTDQEYYYSNTTKDLPVHIAMLEHIAGVGSSPVVNYQGYGAYFIDKLENGVWRLEVMPDAISIRDPFERPSLKKEVTRIQWEPEQMSINLPDLGNDFNIKPLNSGNTYTAALTGKNFIIKPGVYLLVRKDHKNSKWNAGSNWGTLKLDEYAAPKPFDSTPYVVHHPFAEVSAGHPFIIKATIVGVNAHSKITVVLHNSEGGRYQTIDMTKKTPYDYEAQIGRELLNAGLLSYKIVIQNGPGNFVVFPGNHPGDPAAWDNYNNEEWKTYVSTENTPLVLFNANNDQNRIDGINRSAVFITSSTPKQLALSLTARNDGGQGAGDTGFHVYLTDKLNGRRDELNGFTKLIVKAKTQNAAPVKMKIALIDDEGSAYATYIMVDKSLKNIEIPINSLQKDSYMLWPRPYPEFSPSSFKSESNSMFNINHVNMLEVVIGQGAAPGQSYNLDIESVMLQK
ncbi:MAG: rane or secreted protein [Mucilaginibacter sp.]|nr:rane or secreted protein [Mucilaginibacter sp.]